MQPRWKIGLTIAVPSALVLAFIAWGGYWVMLRVREINPARAALQTFLESVRAGRLEEAYRAGAPEFRCRMTFEQFRGLASYYGKLQPGVGADVELRRGWPAMPLADIDVSTHYDQDIPHHAAMLKLEGGWRVAWIDRKPALEVQGADTKCGERSMHIAMIREPLRDLLQGLETGDYTALAARFHVEQGRGAAFAESDYARLKPKAAALKEALAADPMREPDAPASGDLRKLGASLRAQGVRFAIRAHYRLVDRGWKLVLFEVDAASTPD
jgi:hypothetical protein